MDRKSFIKKVGAACLMGIPAISLWSSCSDSNDDDGSGGNGSSINCINNGTGSDIDNNHGHTIAVPKEDVSAGIEKTYDITGTSDHAHEVTVTEAHFVALQNNATITIESTSGVAHTHEVTIFCASA